MPKSDTKGGNAPNPPTRYATPGASTMFKNGSSARLGSNRITKKLESETSLSISHLGALFGGFGLGAGLFRVYLVIVGFAPRLFCLF